MRLCFAGLPDLPQISRMKEIAERLWVNQSVVALWVGGSLASATADRFSDIDLRIAVRPEDLHLWRAPVDRVFAGQCVGKLWLALGEEAFLHHLLLANGDLYDVMVQATEHTLYNEAVLILGCRDAIFQEHLQQDRGVLSFL
jgi:hypothetical protein